jgi:hypothetical protein
MMRKISKLFTVAKKEVVSIYYLMKVFSLEDLSA